MRRRGMSQPIRQAATPNGETARVRSRIDAGLHWDKAPGLDPAAAPFGTDAEAAGARAPILQEPPGEPPPRRRRRGANAVAPQRTPDGQAPLPGFILPAVTGVALALLLAAAIPGLP